MFLFLNVAFITSKLCVFLLEYTELLRKVLLSCYELCQKFLMNDCVSFLPSFFYISLIPFELHKVKEKNFAPTTGQCPSEQIIIFSAC